MRTDLLRFRGVAERDPAIDAWLAAQTGELGELARRWFAAMRRCGDEVREVLHDGGANACFGDVPFAYVYVFKRHVNVGFFQGASLPDPSGLLQGTGRWMRHVKLMPGTAFDEEALARLIDGAYAAMKALVENG